MRQSDNVGENNDAFSKIFPTIFTKENVSRNVAQTVISSNQKRGVRKIPRELLRKKIQLSQEQHFAKRCFVKLSQDSQFLRSTIQFAFALLCVWIGIEFYFFMQWGMSNGMEGSSYRPPGVEGFLPISALMSLKYWFATGSINEIHPASIFILLAILAVSLFLKKAFCSWLCPVGTLSESLWRIGETIFGRNARVTRWLDYPLRSLKYVLLLFFVYSIWQMDVQSLADFIYSPYNKMADVKMYLFFANITSFALWTIVVLMFFSLFIKNFWCRYLCPYGALLGMLSWLSPVKIFRSKSSCIDCELCTKVCPASINVHKGNTVWSDECTSCLECVEVCPVKNTLEVKTHFTNNRVSNVLFGVLVVGIFAAMTFAAMLANQWQNKISQEEYLQRFPNIESSLYQHNRGEAPKEINK
ncbi:MAG: 4Fe-4S binding protein [Ignavibacteria bacterium]|nr:4Fe-4S binding protein [Ignavibacteria bacterium]